MHRQARYLVRFDDLCPTMNWVMWARIESLLVEQKIHPILAVIPDNQDPKLVVSPARSGFWNEVRSWQARGWAIGLHGYQHKFVNQNPGMVGIQRRSEFAGLGAAEQREKLTRALEIFANQRIDPTVWVAPAHSFDRNTVAGLLDAGLDVISDGLALRPHTDDLGMFWVPQQLWRFRARPFGVWTVTYHHNAWSEAQFERFRRDLQAFGSAISDLSSIKAEYSERRLGLLDTLYSAAHSAVLSLRTQPRVSA